MQEMLEQMQKMRQSRIEEVWRHLQEMPHTIKAAKMSLQEGQRKLLLARCEEEEILNELGSYEQLVDWVRARKSCQNRMLERALERAMRRALAAKREACEREGWEEQQLLWKWKRARAGGSEREPWEWEWDRREEEAWFRREREREAEREAEAESDTEAEKRLREGWERERRRKEEDLRDQQWRHEWKRREKERQALDQVELKELELEERQLRRRHTQGKGGEELEPELQLARNWESQPRPQLQLSRLRTQLVAQVMATPGKSASADTCKGRTRLGRVGDDAPESERSEGPLGGAPGKGCNETRRSFI